MNVPRHLAIIMDGNGRWAKARRHGRIFGHVRGAKVAKNVIDACQALGVPYLTLFAFSTENWFRPSEEISFLMTLLRRHLEREAPNLKAKNIRFQVIGDLNRLPEPVRQVVADAIRETKDNTGLVLTFALSYGGRQEITEMAREVARQARLGLLDEKDIDDATVARLMPSSFLPDPDLIIRTSGESRLSNFFLWQS
ncbi:MAG TPA: polyprenyl diphosphate synthase, partial [Bdellovibrionales bacterium]|nr:polyprenyl diphosphate synthase [Bdellovibrionales bacterium]